MEFLPYDGQSAQDRSAFQQYLTDLQRGKSMTQLKAVADTATAQIQRSWSARSFTAVTTADGTVYNAIVCNISYHYNKHGFRFGNVGQFTQKAKQYFTVNRQLAKSTRDGLLKFPNGSLFEQDGRIVTYVP